MKRLALISLTISGTVLFVFVVNLLLFCFVPAYHDALESAVAGDSEIPVVVIDENKAPVIIQKQAVVQDEDDKKVYDNVEISLDKEVPLSGNIDSESFDIDSKSESNMNLPEDDCEKRIIDKTYHEDCGTGKGYWVITYEDGSTSIE